MTIKIYSEDNEFKVWAEPDGDAEYIGMCLGVGATREKALEDASDALAELARQVRANMRRTRKPVVPQPKAAR